MYHLQERYQYKFNVERDSSSVEEVQRFGWSIDESGKLTKVRDNYRLAPEFTFPHNTCHDIRLNFLVFSENVAHDFTWDIRQLGGRLAFLQAAAC